jgi:anti-anti-sigma factor
VARKKNPVVVNLPDEFQISMVNDRYKEFIGIINEERPVVVDMAQVNSVDYAGLQLLYSLMRSCEEKELDFSLTNVSQVVEHKIDLCGLNLLKVGENGSV